MPGPGRRKDAMFWPPLQRLRNKPSPSGPGAVAMETAALLQPAPRSTNPRMWVESAHVWINPGNHLYLANFFSPLCSPGAKRTTATRWTLGAAALGPSCRPSLSSLQLLPSSPPTCEPSMSQCIGFLFEFDQWNLKVKTYKNWIYLQPFGEPSDKIFVF